jgi:hypothetical protein
MKLEGIPNFPDTPENREIYKSIVMKTLDDVLKTVSKVRQQGGRGNVTLTCDAVSACIGVMKNEVEKL